MQYYDGTGWVDVARQVRTPDEPRHNYNKVEFPDITIQKLRVLTTPKPRRPTANYGIGLKEIQVFDTA